MVWLGKITEDPHERVLAGLGRDVESFPAYIASDVLQYTNLKQSAAAAKQGIFVDKEGLRRALEAHAREEITAFLEKNDNGKKIAEAIGWRANGRNAIATEQLRVKFAEQKQLMHGMFERSSVEEDIGAVNVRIQQKLSMLTFRVHSLLNSEMGLQR